MSQGSIQAARRKLCIVSLRQTRRRGVHVRSGRFGEGGKEAWIAKNKRKHFTASRGDGRAMHVVNPLLFCAAIFFCTVRSIVGGKNARFCS